jgi:hypothetical protein
MFVLCLINRVCLRVNLKEKGRPTQEYTASPATSWAGLPMSILADFGWNEQEYIDQEKHKDSACPEGCPWCGGQGCLIGHGYYPRKAKDEQRAYRIRVKRWLCKNCHRTVSMLPNFLLPYRQYLVRVIQGVVVAFYEFGQNWRRVRQTSMQDGTPNLRTMQRWCKALAGRAPT